jgi:ribA/ribD-fused uncharacterized protein
MAANMDELNESSEPQFHIFYGLDSPYDNFYASPFSLPIHNHKPIGYQAIFNYFCVEQRFMHMKAIMFDDYKSDDHIMECYDPGIIKMIGRKVKNYDDDVWAAKRFDIMEEAVYAKFSQNPELREKIINEKGIFVEASPLDKIWGIGLDKYDPRCHIPEKWKGLNLLGKVLDNVRERLTKECN